MSAASATTTQVAPDATSGSSINGQTGAELLPAADTLWHEVYHVVEPLPAPDGEQLWRAHRTDTAEEIVVRVMPGTKGDGRSAVWSRLCLIELSFLQRARDAFFVAGRRVEVLDGISGVPLDAWRAARPSVDAATVETIVRQLTEALGVLHASGMVHLGLRPGVIFVREEKDVLHCTLAGLETVALFDGDKPVPASVDPLYAPPEAAALQRHEPGPALCAWDWWSLGRVVQELVLGRHIFDQVAGPDVAQSEAKRAEHAEAVLLEPAAKGLRAGAVELMVGLEPRLDLLLRGLLSSSQEVRWGGEYVDRWLRQMPVKEYYTTPRTDKKFRWRGRLCSVSDAAKELRSAEFWAEAAAHVFEADTPGRLANFIGRSPEHLDTKKNLKEMLALAGADPLRSLPPAVSREVVLTLALLQLAETSLTWRGRRLDGECLHAVLAEQTDNPERLAFLRALTDRSITAQIERWDFEAGRSLLETGRLAAEAEAIIRRHGWLGGPDETVGAQVFRLAIAPDAMLQAACGRLRHDFAGSNQPTMDVIIKNPRLARAELVALAWAEPSAARCGFVTHADWEAKQLQDLHERGRPIVAALSWSRLGRALAVGPAVFGSWLVVTACWGVIAFVVAALWPGPAGVAAGLTLSALAAVARIAFSSVVATTVRRFAPEARPWTWRDGAKRCSGESQAAGPAVDRDALEAAFVEVNAGIAKLTLLKPAPSPVAGPPQFGALHTVALASWLVLAAIFAGCGWRVKVHPLSLAEFRSIWTSSASVLPSSPVGVTGGAVSTPVAAQRAAAEADVSGADAVKVAWPYKPGNEAKAVTVIETLQATSAQESYAMKHGPEIVEPYRADTINTLIFVEVPAGHQIGVMIYDGVGRELVDHRVRFLESRPDAHAWIGVGRFEGIYFGQQ